MKSLIFGGSELQEIKLSVAEEGRVYLVKKLTAPPELKTLLITYGIIPGNIIKVKKVKGSGNALLVEIPSLSRLIAISRELAESVYLQEVPA